MVGGNREIGRRLQFNFLNIKTSGSLSLARFCTLDGELIVNL